MLSTLMLSLASRTVPISLSQVDIWNQLTDYSHSLQESCMTNVYVFNSHRKFRHEATLSISYGLYVFG